MVEKHLDDEQRRIKPLLRFTPCWPIHHTTIDPVNPSSPLTQGLVKVRGDPADLASAVNQIDCYPGEYKSNASFPPARGARRPLDARSRCPALMTKFEANRAEVSESMMNDE